MRIVVWNCCNGLSHKDQVELFRSFDADLAILPELRERNIEGLKPNEAVWITNNFQTASPKGLGVLAFNGTSLKSLDRDPDMEIYIPLEVSHRTFAFNLLAVWNFYSACKQGRFKGVKNSEDILEWSAVRHYAPLMKQDFLFAGDFNFGPTFSRTAFIRLTEMLAERGVESHYHRYFGLSAGVSNHSSFRTPNGHEHHLDHAFGSVGMAKRFKKFEILPLDQAVRSDHAPLVIDFE